jgi:hypothetical protein
LTDGVQTATTSPRPASRPVAVSRSIAIAIFGVIVPVLILGQAYLGLSAMQNSVLSQLKQPPTGLVIDTKVTPNPTGNDYALFAMSYAEASNRQIIVNKQVLKVSVMEVGLAVASLGLMLILLGFELGPTTVGGTSGGFSLNIQAASGGVVVFLAGAAMSAAGGLLSNEYTTVGTPEFAQVLSDGVDQQLAGYYQECKQSAGAQYKDCFTDQYEILHPDLAK